MKHARILTVAVLLAAACHKADFSALLLVSPPAVTLATPASTQRGDVSILHTLFDTQSDPVSILVEYSVDGGATWSPASPGPGGDGVSGLASSPGGTPHVFVWDSLADGAGDPTLELDVRVRITPSDGQTGLPVETGDFRVHNGVVTAFRITSLALRDPHVFVDIPFFGCTDVTDSSPVGPGLNEAINDELTMDGDMDGFYDASLLLLFRQLEPVGTPSMVEFAEGLCAVAGPSCDLGTPGVATAGTYTSTAVGPCLAPGAGTTSGYTPALLSPSVPCFTSQPFDFVLPLPGGATLGLRSARLGATLNGPPVTTLTDGLLMGFISEAEAAATTIDTPIGPVTLASLLPGGGGCAPGDDRDLGPDGITLGWWIYFNFTADLVTYTGP